MMSKYFVLMNVRRELPLEHNKTVDFSSMGSVGCLLVFDSLESLRDISPHGKYIEIERSNQTNRVTKTNNA